MKSTIKTLGLFAAGVLLSTSCGEDWLTVENPTGEPLEEYYNTDEKVFEALTAAYDPLEWPDWGLGQYNALNIDSEIMGDLFWVGGSNYADMQNWHLLSDFNGNQSNTLSSLWTVDYSGIKRCNDVLKYIGWADEKGNLTKENKASYSDQARVLRVFYYNMLWHYFGNVPYFLTDLTDPYTAPQLTADEVYDNLIVELEDVLGTCSLPMRWDNANAGRVSKAMAYMLYAEMVAYQNDTARFGKALGYMNEIINSGDYDLKADYAGIWAESGEWCEESIWEINYESANNDRGWSWALGTGGTVLPTLISPNSWPGGDGWAGGDGWGFLPVRVSTYNMFEEGDTRRDATCWDVRGVEYTNRYQDTHIWLAKYRPFTETNAAAGFDNNLNYNNNLRYYRFSECLLYAAEFIVRGAGQGNAKDLLTKVRKRAGLGEVEATLDNIMAERKLEFVGEGKRYWDLVRMVDVSGASENALTALVECPCDGTNPTDEGRIGHWTKNKKYIPIAQGELDSDPALKQNEEYFK